MPAQESSPTLASIQKARRIEDRVREAKMKIHSLDVTLQLETVDKWRVRNN